MAKRSRAPAGDINLRKGGGNDQDQHQNFAHALVREQALEQVTQTGGEQQIEDDEQQKGRDDARRGSHAAKSGIAQQSGHATGQHQQHLGARGQAQQYLDHEKSWMRDGVDQQLLQIERSAQAGRHNGRKLPVQEDQHQACRQTGANEIDGFRGRRELFGEVG
jgi:hypothetical protein